jgi:hypothetical protein
VSRSRRRSHRIASRSHRPTRSYPTDLRKVRLQKRGRDAGQLTPAKVALDVDTVLVDGGEERLHIATEVFDTVVVGESLFPRHIRLILDGKAVLGDAAERRERYEWVGNILD